MDALEKAREAAARLREAGEMTRLTPAEKAARNPKSLRLAVNAFCVECVAGRGATSGASVSRDIRECTAPKCPLFNVRPYR